MFLERAGDENVRAVFDHPTTTTARSSITKSTIVLAKPFGAERK
jgi:hypothetical protein